jgi:hypothetical protein
MLNMFPEYVERWTTTEVKMDFQWRQIKYWIYRIIQNSQYTLYILEVIEDKLLG